MKARLILFCVLCVLPQAEVCVSLSQVLAKCGQSFHMELYRTCHLYHHGKLFYFSLNTETDRVRKGLKKKEMKERDKGSEMVELREKSDGFLLLSLLGDDRLILRQRQISRHPTILPASHHLTRIAI